MLFDLLSQLALSAIARHPSRAAHGIFRSLALNAAGLLAAIVLLMLALLCAAAGALIMYGPPLDAPHLLFLLSAGLVVLAALSWLIFCKGKGPGQLVSEALHAPRSPLDEVTNTVERFSNAFTRGWQSR